MRIAMLLLMGCGTGQFGEEDEAGCEEVARSVVDSAALAVVETFDGEEQFVPDEVLEWTRGPRAQTLAWEIGETTNVTGEVSGFGIIERVMFEAIPSPGLDVAWTCPDRLQTSGRLRLSTDDGRLDEEVPAVITLGAGSTQVEALVLTPSGTIDPSEMHLGNEQIRASEIELRVGLRPNGSVPDFTGVVEPVHERGAWEDVRSLGHWPQFEEEGESE